MNMGSSTSMVQRWVDIEAPLSLPSSVTARKTSLSISSSSVAYCSGGLEARHVSNDLYPLNRLGMTYGSLTVLGITLIVILTGVDAGAPGSKDPGGTRWVLPLLLPKLPSSSMDWDAARLKPWDPRPLPEPDEGCDPGPELTRLSLPLLRRGSDRLGEASRGSDAGRGGGNGGGGGSALKPAGAPREAPTLPALDLSTDFLIPSLPPPPVPLPLPYPLLVSLSLRCSLSVPLSLPLLPASSETRSDVDLARVELGEMGDWSVLRALRPPLALVEGDEKAPERGDIGLPSPPTVVVVAGLMGENVVFR